MRFVKAEEENRDWWMSDLYRAPEVLLQLPWGFPVDIWAIGVMVRRTNPLHLQTRMRPEESPTSFINDMG